jgi:hypothetical protein
MKAIKFLGAILLSIASTCANAVIIDIDYRGWVGLEYYDDELWWGKPMWQSEVTGKFWYDTELAPARAPVHPDYPNYYLYSSETNSWLNMIMYIDGKVFDISKPEGGSAGMDYALERINLNVDYGTVTIKKETLEGDLSGDYLLKMVDIRMGGGPGLIQHGGLEQAFSWNEDSCCSDMYFIIHGRENGIAFRSTMELAITSLTATIRPASVPEPSSFLLMLLGLIVLMFRRRIHLSARH